MSTVTSNVYLKNGNYLSGLSNVKDAGSFNSEYLTFFLIGPITWGQVPFRQNCKRDNYFLILPPLICNVAFDWSNVVIY